MEYIELDIQLSLVNPYSEILVAELNEIYFESFKEEKTGIKAYIKTDVFNKVEFQKIISKLEKKVQIKYQINYIKNDNWNKNWESSFSPVKINDQCVVRANFHSSFPDKKYEIIITPKMAFGTGHHETTSLLMDYMFNIPFKNKSFLDVGCGTGILSILASNLGASQILAIDIDSLALNNSKENAIANNTFNINFSKSTVDEIKDQNFDIIIANINRNIILQDLSKYCKLINDQGDIILSGFLTKDLNLMIAEIKKINLNIVASKNKNKWEILHLRKN